MFVNPLNNISLHLLGLFLFSLPYQHFIVENHTLRYNVLRNLHSTVILRNLILLYLNQIYSVLILHFEDFRILQSRILDIILSRILFRYEIKINNSYNIFINLAPRFTTFMILLFLLSAADLLFVPERINLCPLNLGLSVRNVSLWQLS